MVFAQCCWSPARAFESSWGFDFDSAMRAPWFFFFSSYSFFLHFPVAWLNFYHILTVGQMASQTLLLNALTYRGVYCQLNNCKVSISCVCKRSPTHHRSTTVWCCDVFMLICWVWISSNVARLTPPPQSLLSFYPNYSRSVVFFFQLPCFFRKQTSHTCSVFFCNWTHEW